MNYIKNLEQQVASLTAKNSDAVQMLIDFRAELMSSKFIGYDSDGDRMDWMSTSDIDRRLVNLLAAI